MIHNLLHLVGSLQWTRAICSCGNEHLLTDAAHEMAEHAAPISGFEFVESMNRVVLSKAYEKFLREYSGLVH